MSIDRAELQDAARKAFGNGGAPLDADASWRMIAEMGWLMMTVPEDLGGLGLDREAEGVIHSELGRALVPGPAIAQMLVISALSAAVNLPERDNLLARAMDGELMTTSVNSAADGSAVIDADRASHVLVVTNSSILLQPLDASGVHIVQRDTWDKTRRLFDVSIDDASAALVIAKGDGAELLAERLQMQMLLALAGDSIGGATAILALTVDYLKTRRQFDRPLAMFQALKHRVADLKTWHAAAEALYWSRATGAATLAETGALKAHASSVYCMIAEEAIQLHGGIGLTSEHYCHLYLKRAALNAALGGDADYWDAVVGRERMAAPQAIVLD